MNCFVEYDCSNVSEAFAAQDSIRAINHGPLVVGSGYDLFDVLADGRRGAFDRDDPRVDGPQAFIQPRGIPDPASEVVLSQYYHLITEPHIRPWRCGGLPNVDHETANRWRSDFDVNDGPPLITFSGGKRAFKTRISSPYLRNATWLRDDEIAAAMNSAGITVDSTNFEFRCVLSLLEEAVCEFGKNSARLVLWFDD